MGHNLALVLTPIVFYLGVKAHQWWKANHSPTDGPIPIGGVKSQVGSDVTPVDPTSGTPDGEGKTILRAKPSVDAWLAQQQASARRTNELIRDGARRFGVSVSTMKRRLRKIRGGAPR
jgi:hypothetical protein